MGSKRIIYMFTAVLLIFAAGVLNIGKGNGEILVFAAAISAGDGAGGTTTTYDNGDGTQSVVWSNPALGYNADIITLDFSNGDKIRMEGVHKNTKYRLKVGESHIVYETTGFTFNRARPEDEGCERGAVTQVAYRQLGEGEYSKYDIPDGESLTTVYEIDWEDFFDILNSLYTKEELASEDGVTIYMSNIFRTKITTRVKEGNSEDCFIETTRTAYADSLNDILSAEGWGDETWNKLHAYYSIPIRLEKQFYKVHMLHSNCVECAAWWLDKRQSVNGLGEYTETGITCVHGNKSAWIMFDEMSDEEVISQTKKRGQVIQAFRPYLSVGGVKKQPAVRVLKIPSRSGTGYRIDEECNTFLQFIRNGAYGTELLGERISEKGDEPESDFVAENAYYLWMKENGNFGIRVSRRLAADAVIIVPYESEEDEENEEPDTPAKPDEIVKKDNITYLNPAATGTIFSGIFNVTDGIPSGELLNARVKAAEYLFDARFETVSGTKQYKVAVELPYTLIWYTLVPVAGPDGTVVNTTVTNALSGVTGGYINISRQYRYTALSSLGYYIPDYAWVRNQALPGETEYLYPVGYSPPQVSKQVYDAGDDGHIIEPAERNHIIILPAKTVNGGFAMPAVPVITQDEYHDFVDLRIGEISVRNDSLMFDGKTVLNDAWTDTAALLPDKGAVRAPAQIADAVLLRTNMLIEPELANGSYSSQGAIYYSAAAAHGDGIGSTLSYGIDGINSVHVHTPVFCDAELINDNARYVQLADADISKVPLVIGRSDSYGSKGHENDSSDFEVVFSNTGQHLAYRGYGFRQYVYNYSRQGTGMYIAGDSTDNRPMNQVRFPFDVYADTGNDSDETNDILVYSGTWFTTGLTKQRFYLPEWVREGDYEVMFRTIAVNGIGKRAELCMVGANLSDAAYTATDSVMVQISGKLYGLMLYDVEDSHNWPEVFRSGRETAPKLIYGLCRNKYSDGTINGKGFDSNNFYYYTAGGCNELGRPAGRQERFTMPLMEGSNPVFINKGVLKAGYLWRFRLYTTGTLMNSEKMGIRISMRFFYVSNDGTEREEVDLYYRRKEGRKVSLESADKVIPVNMVRKNDTAGELEEYMEYDAYRQQWYFEYCMPEELYVVSRGTDVAGYMNDNGIDFNESFKKRDGYIVVNFTIDAVDEDDRVYITYNAVPYNPSGANMWELAGQCRSRTDYDGRKFAVEYGDVIMLYTDISRPDDYTVKRLY